uniref:Leukocyte elastase inhibitor A-like n=1 Tax=Erpetoichthys calabaricus TaxID=27687 RepID=A0A8C4TI04_ERPCA
MESLSEANSQFFLDLFKNLSEANRGDVFFSPFSISPALAMVYLGARGDTAAQMEQVSMHEGCIQCWYKSIYNSLKCCNFSSKFSFDSTSTIHLANHLFGEKTLLFGKDYLDETRKLYHAELESVDFITSSESARQNINSWVEKQTEGKIVNLLSEGAIDPVTRLLLVSAIYFKGDWQKKFRMDKTKEEQFRLNKKDTKNVMMMYKSAQFNYALLPDVNAQIIELPYAGEDFSMFVLLPKDIENESTGLEKVRIHYALIHWTSKENLHYTKMNLYLPRFKMEETYNLKIYLSIMGMTDVFNTSICDLSGISSAEGLYVSEVIHKAFVDANEEGTVAAVATGLIMKPTPHVFPKVFKADHPFAFFIRHKTSNSIPFSGTVVVPQVFKADHPFIFFIRHNKSNSILYSARVCSP